MNYYFRQIILLFSLVGGLMCTSGVFAQTTYYSYRGVNNGSWNNPLTWTTSLNGEDSQNPAVPGNGDIVYIVQNRTVLLPANIATTGLRVIVEEGSSLDFNSFTFTSGLQELSGQGAVKLASNQFPAVINNQLVQPAGGTVEYYNFNGLLPVAQNTYNHLILSGIAGSFAYTLGNNLSLNGNFEIRNGAELIIGNNATVRNLIIAGDLSILNGAGIRIGNFNAIHNISIGGNMLNNGSVDLTNSNKGVAASNGAAVLTFTGAANTSLMGNGAKLDFYRLIIDKGLDKTFELHANPTNFELWAPTNTANTGTGLNPVINKALWIKNGTLRLGSNVIIPELSQGGSDFFIPQNAALWIDGATVNVTTSSGAADNTGLTVIGGFRITEGSFFGNKSPGIVYREDAKINIDGGMVNISMFRSSIATVNQTAIYEQTGGIVNIGGTGQTDNNFARFSLPSATHTFIMSGGEISIINPTNIGFLALGSGPGYFNVSGGTVNLTLPGGDLDRNIAARPPLFNLTISKSGAGQAALSVSDIAGIGNQPLTINNNLVLQNNALLRMNNNDLNIAGNFTLAAGARYIPGTNTTRFFWHSASNNAGTTISIADNTGVSPMEFHNLLLDKADGGNNFNNAKSIWITSPGRSTDAGNPASIIAYVNGIYSVDKYRNTLQLGNFRLSLKGNVSVIAGRQHRIEQSGTSRILINGTVSQQLSLSGLARSNSFNLDNSQGAVLQDNARMGNLNMISGLFSIANNQLTVNNPIEGAPFSATKMIVTSGTASSGGVRLLFRNRTINGGTEVIYPLGVSGKYTPFFLIFPGTGVAFANVDNFISINNVDGKHPSVENIANGTRYFWQLRTQFSGTAPSGSINYRAQFVFNDRITAAGGGNKRSYVVSGGSPTEIGSYNESAAIPANNFLLANNTNFLSGDIFGATQNSINPGNVANIFESNGNGPWNAQSSWTRVQGNNGNFPEAGDAAIIRSGHTITTGRNNERAALVTIQSGGTLDVQTFTGHQFTRLNGSGRLRSATATLPLVDDGMVDFLVNNNSALEFYGTNPINIPAVASNVYNLTLSGSGTKTLPNVNLSIRNVLQINGAPVLTSDGINGNISVTGALRLDDTGASFTIRPGANRSISASQVRVWDNTSLLTANTGTNTHTLIISGDLDMRGTVDLHGNGTNVCNVLMAGPGNAVLGRNGRFMKLHRLIIEKTNLTDTVSVSARLELAAPANTANKPLQMISGTFWLRNTEGSNATDITLTSGGPDFAIPATAALIVTGNASPANIIRASGNSGIVLDGRLEVRGNGQALLNGGENFIRYASSGLSEIIIANNGTLLVGGQIRRSASEPGGNLKFTQSGGTVRAGTMAASANNRGVFEILNSGSRFVHTGGLLAIARSSGNATGDIILQPESHEVSGDAVLAIDATAPGQSITLRSNIPLNDVHILQSNAPALVNQTFPLHIQKNLLIETGSSLATSNLNTFIGGNAINAGSFIPGTSDTTFFNGIVQNIEGSMSFANLVVQSNSGLTLQSASPVTVSRNLAIQGLLTDGGNLITVMGDVNNTSGHISTSAATGGIRMAGSVSQIIRGGASMGRLIIDNTAGVVLRSDLQLNRDLILDNGVFNIENQSLVLSENSNIQGAGFGISKMIATGGDFGDAGLRKRFNAGSGIVFDMPLGVPGKFTPVTLSFSHNTPAGAYIEINPVNAVHPTITPPQGDPARVLQYYWGLRSLMNQFSGSLSFTFNNSDVSGTINDYFTSQLKENDTWAKVNAGVDIANNRLTFTNNNIGSADLNGFYTAGEDSAIPNVIDIFTASSSGDWDIPATWTSNAVPPSGVIVSIPAGIDVEILTNQKRVYKTIINGRLDIDPVSTFHNLGIVSGQGTIALENDFLPPGRYNDFLSCNGGTVIYGGNGNYTLSDRFEQYKNIIFAGTGQRLFPQLSELNICGNMEITGASVVTRANMTTRLGGSLLKTTGTLQSNLSGYNLILNGNNPQIISGSFLVANNESFRNLRMQNSNGLNLASGTNLEISGNLFFNNGIINTQSALLRIANTTTNAIQGAGSTGFINGPLIRNLSGGNTYLFPVGKGTAYEPMSLINASAGNWTSEYIAEDPLVGRINVNTEDEINGGFTMTGGVFGSGYWAVDGTGSAQVQLTWNGATTVEDFIGNLRVAEWAGSIWNNIGAQNLNTTGARHSVNSNPTGFSQKLFAFATTELTNLPLPVELVSFEARVVEGRIVELTWVTATETNNAGYVIERTTDGIRFDEMAEVNSQAPEGNSRIPLTYTFIDDKPIQGQSYYRLRQSDFDGSIHYSPLVGVFLNTVSSLTGVVYPNPTFDGRLNLITEGYLSGEKVAITVFDVNGRPMHIQEAFADRSGRVSTLLLPVMKLPAGLYILSCHAIGKRDIYRFIVQD